MSAVFRLQDLASVSDSEIQSKEDALDLLAYKSIVFCVRKPVAADATTGVLHLQHAATLDDDAFVTVTSPTFDLKTTTTEVKTATDLLRYVRWSAEFTMITSGPQFLIDVVAREG